MEQILITGANGYLGSKLIEWLLRRNVSVVALVRSTSNLQRLLPFVGHANFSIYKFSSVATLGELFQRFNIKTIIHLATSYGRKGETEADVYKANVEFPLSLLEIACQYPNIWWINTHTSLSEEVNHYARTKHEFLGILNNYSTRVLVTNLILEYFYGFGDDEWKFIPMLFRHFRAGTKEVPLTSGEQTRFFYHIDDVVEAFGLTLGNSKRVTHNGKLVSLHVCTQVLSEQISIRQLAETCRTVAGAEAITDLSFGILKNRPQEYDLSNTFKYPSITCLGWQPKTSLNDGLTTVWNEYKKI
jgi:CDP-paratose synthetase